MLVRRIVFFFFFPILLVAQQLPSPNAEVTPPKKETEAPAAPQKVEVKPTARDHEIRERLQGILNATGWFKSPSVQVREGVVFLEGFAKSKDYKTWAGQLATNTQDVSAVVNKIEVLQPSIWDFEPSWTALKHLWADFIRILPSMFFALLILLITWGVSRGVAKLSRKLLSRKVFSSLLQKVLSQAIGVLVFLLGLYIIFKILGLTTVAFTIIGGTGILGIILGIAFRDITENLLASIFLSIHHPFQSGDLVKIGNCEGYIQRLTIRSTVLINLSGNHVQIPNATVYKSDIVNFTANPNRCESFVFEIDMKEDIPKTQEIALNVLRDHPTILKDPEPLVLLQDLSRSLAQIKVYFWLDGSQHSWLKVRSSVIRLVKSALQQHKIVFATDQHSIDVRGPIQVETRARLEEEKKPVKKEAEPIATKAEAELKSESSDIEEQARAARAPGKGEQDLLKPQPPDSEQKEKGD